MKNRKPLILVLLAAIAILTGILLTQVKPAGALPGYDHVVDVWEQAWNEILQYTPAGQYYETLFTRHAEEVQAITEATLIVADDVKEMEL